MGASSVTGTGQGSTKGLDKGKQSLGIGNLLGPKVVAAGQHTLAGAADVIAVAGLEGVVGDYIVIATDQAGAAAGGELTALNQVTLRGTATNTLNWCVIEVGNMPVATV